jgi:uncharacterized protein YegP (UPF0339 family)
MSGHRPFQDLLSVLPEGRRNRIDREVDLALSEIDRASSSAGQASKFMIYRGSDGLLRWRLVTASGQILADSGRGFQHRSECLDSIERLRTASSTLAVEDAA